MESVGTIQTIYNVLAYLYAAHQKTKENAEECKRLCAHVETTLKLIEGECGGIVSERLDKKLQKLAEYVLYIIWLHILRLP